MRPVETRGTKTRDERSCVVCKGAGSVTRTLFGLHLPQGDTGQVAAVRFLGMFLLHTVVVRRPFNLDLSLAQSLTGVVGPQRVVSGASVSTVVLDHGFQV